MNEPTPGLGILLLDKHYERVHYGLMMAAAALACSRKVVVFATNHAIHGLCKQWEGLEGANVEDKKIRANGVGGLVELREAIIEMGGELLACEAGLKIAAISPDRLLPEVKISGIVTFLDKTRSSQLICL